METQQVIIYTLIIEFNRKKAFFFILACNIVGIVPLFVAGASLVLIALHMVQLRTLKAFLRQPGPHSSSDHSRPPHIFWRLVIIL